MRRNRQSNLTMLDDRMSKNSEGIKSTKYLLGFFGLLLASGLAAMLFFGIRPRTLPKIKLSEFTNATVVSNAFQLRMRQDMKDWPVLFVGIDPNEPFHVEVLNHFLSTNTEPGWKYDAVVVDQDLGVNISQPNAEVFSFRRESDRLLSGLITLLKNKTRVLLVVKHVESSQSIQNNFLQRLKTIVAKQMSVDQMQIPFTVLSLAWFPRTRELEKDMPIPCITNDESDQLGTGALGCKILHLARLNYRKKFTAGQWVGQLDLVGSNDYLFLLSKEPQR